MRCASCIGFRISTTLPLPSTVAPAIPDSRDSWGPIFFTIDFLIAQQFVHMQGDTLFAAAQQQHRIARLVLLGALHVAQQVRQIVQRIGIALPFDLPFAVQRCPCPPTSPA